MCSLDIIHIIHHFTKTHKLAQTSSQDRTLNSVGTISLGVSSPIKISRPTKVMIDVKMEKSLMSFRSYTFAQRNETGVETADMRKQNAKER